MPLLVGLCLCFVQRGVGGILVRDDNVNRAAHAKAETARKKVAARRQGLKDRRRVIHTNPADGKASRGAKNATGTIFPNRLEVPAVGDVILMDGANNTKIGGDVLVGRLKGARILTLALEERRTCPRSCLIWDHCYGNNMSRAKRWRHGPELEVAIRHQVKRHFEQKTPSKLLVRLHVLGDFYSMDYLRMWVDLVDTYPSLHIFGFTAWDSGSEIGAAIKRVREAAPDQFAIRTSGETGSMGSWTIDWPTEKRFVRVNRDVGMVCPEQLDANATGKRMKHCGSCAACWQSDFPVVFIEH